MCTVSWLHRSDGYDVFFSRDEQRTRVAADPPVVRPGNGFSWIAPRDPQGGGTWIFANSHGMTGCLLNLYGHDGHRVSPTPPSSRGLLLAGLAGAASLGEFDAQLAVLAARTAHAPCMLLAVGRAGAARWVWTGARLDRADLPDVPLLTTSAFEPDRVAATRRRRFSDLAAGHTASADVLRRYHECPGETPGADSVRMSRPDALTVSLTRVSVAGREVRMSYRPRLDDGVFSEGEPHLARIACAGGEGSA